MCDEMNLRLKKDSPEPGKVLYRRLKRWLDRSQQNHIRDKLWMEDVPNASRSEEETRAVLQDTLVTHIFLRDKRQRYVAERLAYHSSRRGAANASWTSMYNHLAQAFPSAQKFIIEGMLVKQLYNYDAFLPVKAQTTTLRKLWTGYPSQPIRDALLREARDTLRTI
jgi:hypothetical protein